MVDVILSGMRPTGRLHIGHIVGALDNWVKLQEEGHKAYYFVADWHAITTQTDTKDIKPDTIEMVKDWLAGGINPDKSTLFIQSQVPQHAELSLILSMLINLGRAERVPSFKGMVQTVLGMQYDQKKLDEGEEGMALTPEQIANAKGEISLGFLGYPVLQAADILLYNTTKVPVGEDQIPHIELTKELARRFNNLYGEVFVVPEYSLTNTPRILGTDGRKMSKSYGNVILPTDNIEAILEGVRKMKIDVARQRVDISGDPEKCNLYDLHYAFNLENNRYLEIARLCKSAGIGCFECKKEAAYTLERRFKQHREKRSQYEGQENKIREILMDGSAKARRVAGETLAKVKEHILFDY